MLKKATALATVIVVLLAFFTVSNLLTHQKASAQGEQCRQNLRVLTDALIRYADDHNGKFPISKDWMDSIDNSKYLPIPNRERLFHCPAAGGLYGYAMNSALSGASLYQSHSGSVVLLFDTDVYVRNANGSASALALPRHYNINYSSIDGNVHWITNNNIKNLNW